MAWKKINAVQGHSAAYLDDADILSVMWQKNQTNTIKYLVKYFFVLYKAVFTVKK